MDTGTLSKAMGGALSLARYEALLPAFNAAMVAAGITTPLRAAHWCSQLGHESGGCWMEESASGAAPGGGGGGGAGMRSKSWRSWSGVAQMAVGVQGCNTSKATAKRWKVSIG